MREMRAQRGMREVRAQRDVQWAFIYLKPEREPASSAPFCKERKDKIYRYDKADWIIGD